MSRRKEQRDKALSGDRLPLPGRWLRHMPPTDAVVLAYLVRAAERVNAERAGGWFQCSAALIERMTGVGADTQRRIIARMEERGLLKTERRAPCPRRWLRIEWGELAKLKP